MKKCCDNSVSTSVTMLALAALSICSACASQGGTPSAQGNVCRVGSTLVCEKRLGDVVKCTCKSKDALRDILEPEPY